MVDTEHQDCRLLLSRRHRGDLVGGKFDPYPTFLVTESWTSNTTAWSTNVICLRRDDARHDLVVEMHRYRPSLAVQKIDTMKLVASLILLASLLQDAVAFSISSSQSLARRSSSLSMNVESAAQKDVIRVGVIGMGRIGLVHLEAITKAPGVTPVIVSNPTVSKAEAGTSSRGLVGSTTPCKSCKGCHSVG